MFTIRATSPSCGSWPQLQGSSLVEQLGARSPSVQTSRREAWTAPSLRLAEGACITQVNARCLQGGCWLPCTSLSPCQKITAATVRGKEKAAEAVVLQLLGMCSFCLDFTALILILFTYLVSLEYDSQLLRYSDTEKRSHGFSSRVWLRLTWI